MTYYSQHTNNYFHSDPSAYQHYPQPKNYKAQVARSPWPITSPKKSAGNVGAVADFFLPRNLVSGRRQLHLIPKKVEKIVGNAAFFLNTMSTQKSFRTMTIDGREQSYQSIAEGILGKLVEDLPSEFKQAHPLRVTVTSSNVMNACAYPSGEIIINDKVIKTIIDATSTGELTKCHCEKSDKSVYFEHTTAKDALAAVIGHEMAHIYARHFSILTSIKHIAKGLFYLLAIGIRVVAHNFYYQTYLQAAKESNLSESWAMERANEKMKMIEVATSTGLMVFTAIWPLIQLYINRSCEYESDQWGMICASNAHFDPRGAILFQEVMKRSRVVKPGFFSNIFEFLSTHPENSNRAEALVEKLQQQLPDLVYDGDSLENSKTPNFYQTGYEDFSEFPSAPTLPDYYGHLPV